MEILSLMRDESVQFVVGTRLFRHVEMEREKCIVSQSGSWGFCVIGLTLGLNLGSLIRMGMIGERKNSLTASG